MHKRKEGKRTAGVLIFSARGEVPQDHKLVSEYAIHLVHQTRRVPPVQEFKLSGYITGRLDQFNVIGSCKCLDFTAHSSFSNTQAVLFSEVKHAVQTAWEAALLEAIVWSA